MEDIETLQRAKFYMEKLANGINPFDNQPVGEEDLLNNVRISRCLFYVAGVLGKIIDNNGVISSPKRTLNQFSILDEQLNGYEYSDYPIPITVVVRKINELVDLVKVKRLRYLVVIDWLKEVGMLEDANGRYGKTKLCPTEMGREIGISIEKRITNRGEFYVIYYNRNAQEFIVNHVQEFTKQ